MVSMEPQAGARETALGQSTIVDSHGSARKKSTAVRAQSGPVMVGKSLGRDSTNPTVMFALPRFQSSLHLSKASPLRFPATLFLAPRAFHSWHPPTSSRHLRLRSSELLSRPSPLQSHTLRPVNTMSSATSFFEFEPADSKCHTHISLKSTPPAYSRAIPDVQ